MKADDRSIREIEDASGRHKSIVSREMVRMRNINILKALILIIIISTVPVVILGCEKKQTISDKPLPTDGFSAEISIENPPLSVKANSSSKVKIRVKNTSKSLWPAKGTGEKFTIKLGDHWLDSHGKILIPDSSRAGLPHDIKPGEEVIIEIGLKAPETPGEYIVEYDMVQEMIVWFKDNGSKTAQLRLKVE